MLVLGGRGAGDLGLSREGWLIGLGRVGDESATCRKLKIFILKCLNRRYSYDTYRRCIRDVSVSDTVSDTDTPSDQRVGVILLRDTM